MWGNARIRNAQKQRGHDVARNEIERRMGEEMIGQRGQERRRRHANAFDARDREQDHREFGGTTSTQQPARTRAGRPAARGGM